MRAEPETVTNFQLTMLGYWLSLHPPASQLESEYFCFRFL